MKHLKTLGLAAVAAMALMAFVGAGTASATKVYETTTSPCTGASWGVGTVAEFSKTPNTTFAIETTEKVASAPHARNRAPAARSRTLAARPRQWLGR